MLGVALAVGLLIGLERGWEKREAEEGARIAGLRTFGLIGLLGGVSALVAGAVGVAILGFTFVGLVIALTTAYAINIQRSGDVGITTLVTGLLTFWFGALVLLDHVTEATAAAVMTALILGFKPVLHGWLRRIETEELRAALKLLLISIVLLPILPDRGFGPWEALNPYRIWWMVVLIAGISYVGYVAMKIAGTRKGAVLTGLFAGLTSSTALTMHYARLARVRPEISSALVPGILIACAMMFPRLLVVAAAINPALLRALWPPVVLMMVVTLAPALYRWRRASAVAHAPAPLGNPLDLSSALRFGALLALIMVLAEGLKMTMGTTGLYLLAAASGVADVDAINLSLARMSQADLSIAVAATGVVIAAAVNNVVKAVLAVSLGGAGIGDQVAVPLGLSAATGLLYVWLA